MEYLHKHAQPFFLEGKDEICLLIHGFTGSPAHMKYLGEFLNQEGGYTVNGILLPGHGTSLEDMEDSDYQDWFTATQKKYENLNEQYKKVYVIGLSMGGVLSLLLAEEYDVDKVVSIAAPIRIYSKLAHFTPILKYFKRFDKWDDPEEDKDKYDVGYSATPVKCVPSLLKLMKRAKKNLKQIDSPVLIIQSRDDRTVKPVSAKKIYNGVSSYEKEILWLKESGHVCTLGSEKGLIHDKILSFLAE